MEPEVPLFLMFKGGQAEEVLSIEFKGQAIVYTKIGGLLVSTPSQLVDLSATKAVNESLVEIKDLCTEDPRGRHYFERFSALDPDLAEYAEHIAGRHFKTCFWNRHKKRPVDREALHHAVQFGNGRVSERPDGTRVFLAFGYTGIKATVEEVEQAVSDAGFPPDIPVRAQVIQGIHGESFFCQVAVGGQAVCTVPRLPPPTPPPVLSPEQEREELATYLVSMAPVLKPEAWVEAQLLVAPNLDLQSPPLFPTEPHHIEPQGVNCFFIVTFADSQRAEGEIVRTPFDCKVCWTADGNWVLESLNTY